MTPSPFRSLLVAVLLPLCACGLPTPEEEAQEVGVSQSALIPRPPGGATEEDPCITECRKIEDRWERETCILKCMARNIR